MTFFSTRVEEIRNREGFRIAFLDRDGTPIDPATNGAGSYDIKKRMPGSKTVTHWKRRFSRLYPGYDCHVFNGNGTVAHGNATLQAVRDSYTR